MINSNVSDQMQLLQSAKRFGSEWIYQVKIDAILSIFFRRVSLTMVFVQFTTDQFNYEVF